MHSRPVRLTMLMSLLLAVFSLGFDVQPASASGTIYIRPDGSVDPPTAPIRRDGDVYTFTGNISDSIVIERSSIVVDGAGYTVTPGPGGGMAIDLSLQTNITVKNTRITGFYAGIYLVYSDHNYIFNNTITHSNFGIYLWYSSTNNEIFDNTVASNDWYGIELDHSSNHNTIHNNKITDNPQGVFFDHLTNSNTMFDNLITSNTVGVTFLHSSSNNTLYHNNFIDNSVQATCDEYSTNVWDSGYPSGGNYWSDYTDVDVYCGPHQDMVGRDGIWDHPHVIDASNTDHYPLRKPCSPGTLSVSISTDTSTYHAGDTMHVGLHVENPDSVKYVCFAIWATLPDSSTYLYRHEHAVLLPIGTVYSNPNFDLITLPSIPSGTYTWHVAFFDSATHTILVEDTAEWDFV